MNSPVLQACLHDHAEGSGSEDSGSEPEASGSEAEAARRQSHLHASTSGDKSAPLRRAVPAADGFPEAASGSELSSDSDDEREEDGNASDDSEGMTHLSLCFSLA